MIFWILLGLAVAVPLIFLTFDWIIPKRRYSKKRSGERRRFDYAFDDSSLESFTVSAIVSAVVLGIGTLILMAFVGNFQTGGVLTKEEKVSLTALQTGKEQIEGKITGVIFLTSGYVQSEPVLSYISNQDGAYRSKWADANKSVVYQDEETSPYVLEREYDFYSAWLVPWPWINEPRFEFHVPEGSVASGYEVAP